MVRSHQVNKASLKAFSGGSFSLSRVLRLKVPPIIIIFAIAHGQYITTSTLIRNRHPKNPTNDHSRICIQVLKFKCHLKGTLYDNMM